MPRPDDAVRIRHLIDAATKAIEFTTDCDRSALDHDEMLRLALTKLVEIVGEAAKQVSTETRQAYPDVPWSAAAKMRDRLIHHYFDINLDILWTTVTVDLPELLKVVPQIDDPPTLSDAGETANDLV